MKMKIHKGDRVRVLRGSEDDKNKVGEVIRVLPRENRVVVQGVNMVKKHQKQTQSGGRTIPSGILEYEASIHASNVAVVDAASEKAAKTARKAAGKSAAEKGKAAEVKADKAKAETKTTAEKKPAAKKPAAKATEKAAAKPARKAAAPKKPAKDS